MQWRRLRASVFCMVAFFLTIAAGQAERPEPAEKYINMVFDLGIPEGSQISTEEGATTALPSSLAGTTVSYDAAVGFMPSFADTQNPQARPLKINLAHDVMQDTSAEPGVSFQNKGFVKTSGTRFTLNGKPYYCVGTNAFYAGLKWIMSDSEVRMFSVVICPFVCSRETARSSQRYIGIYYRFVLDVCARRCTS
jgi:hypothetical protein